MVAGINVLHCHAWAEVVQGVFRVLRAHLRFAGIEPERPDAIAAVTVCDLRPDVLAGLGICRVVIAHEGRTLVDLVPKGEVKRQRPGTAHEQPPPVHLSVVDAVGVHSGPNGNHELDSQLAELVNHRLRVRPLGGIKSPLALTGPMEVIDDDDGERESATLVLARDLEKLVLGPVTELALPEARSPLRQHGGKPGHLGIAADDLGR